MRAKLHKSLISIILTLGFCVSVSAQQPPMPPPITNRLETGGNYQIAPPPSNMMFQISDNPTNAGDDNLIWSNSGRILAIDRSDPNAGGPGGNKYICLLDVRNLGNVQTLGARSSAATNPLFANITGWTWNDDRVLFGWQPQVGNPPTSGKVRLMSCTATGAVSVAPFLQSDPQGTDPTNHVYSPSVVLDPAINKERLLFLVSSSTNNDQNGPTDINTQPNARINLYTVPFDSGGVPNWNERVQLTAFNTNISIVSAKWCPELGTNYQPICNRLEILVVAQPWEGPPPPPPENNKIVIFNNVQSVIADPATAPINLNDPHLIVVETNLTMNSQVSWTFDGQYVMYGRLVNNPPAPPSSDLYSMRADSSTNTAVKFEVPSSIIGGQKQWLAISPDGMKAAFTVDHKAYVIPLQFDNVAVTGAVVTNILTDASYTAVDVSGDAIPSNTTFSIVAPPSVDTNNFNGEFSGYARQFSVSGVSSQFDLLTNASMTLHFSQSDIPSGVPATNLAVYVYNPQAITNGGQTGTWTELASVINTNSQTISCEVQHFSTYAIGRTLAQPEPEPAVAATALAADFDGDRLADPALYNTNGTWSLKLSSGGYTRLDLAGFLGGSGYSAVAGDFDGDRLADPAVYQAATGTWKIKLSSSGYAILPLADFLGGTGYVALAGDFDGDQLTDPAVYLASSGTWKVKLSSAGYLEIPKPDFLGETGWTAISADFDGDGKVDPAIYEAATESWVVMLSSSGYSVYALDPHFLGGTNYVAFAGDFDGDRCADPAVAQTSTGNWKIKLSSGGYSLVDLPNFLGE